MLGCSWVLNQLGSSPLVIEVGPQVPRNAPFETTDSVNAWGDDHILASHCHSRADLGATAFCFGSGIETRIGWLT